MLLLELLLSDQSQWQIFLDFEFFDFFPLSRFRIPRVFAGSCPPVSVGNLLFHDTHDRDLLMALLLVPLVTGTKPGDFFVRTLIIIAASPLLKNCFVNAGRSWNALKSTYECKVIFSCAYFAVPGAKHYLSKPWPFTNTVWNRFAQRAPVGSPRENEWNRWKGKDKNWEMTRNWK